MSSGVRNQPHQLSVALLRVACCLAVIILHTSVPVVFAHGSAGWINWWAGMFLNAATRVAVPIFVMISGGLALNHTKEPARQYWQKRLRRLGLPLLFWTPWYLLFFHFVRGDSLSLQSIAQRLIFSEQYEHLYFLVLLLQLALITPWLRNVLQRRTRQEHLAICVAATLLSLIWQPKQFMPLTWVPYVSYYLWGGYINKYAPSALRRVSYLGVYLVAVVVMAVATRFATIRGVTDNLYFLRYNSPTVLVASWALFAYVRTTLEKTLKQWPATRQERLIDLSHDTLGVYLIAPTVLVVLQSGQPSPALVPMLVTACATTALSWIVVRLFRSAVYLIHHERIAAQ